jgi:hypothetical protein
MCKNVRIYVRINIPTNAARARALLHRLYTMRTRGRRSIVEPTIETREPCTLHYYFIRRPYILDWY